MNARTLHAITALGALAGVMPRRLLIDQPRSYNKVSTRLVRRMPSQNKWPFTGATGFSLESLRGAHAKRLSRQVRNLRHAARGGYGKLDQRTDAQKRQDAEGFYGYGVNPLVAAGSD
ncbi:hypothetical protein CCAX7_54790 [Capsulimonas corticalis]|uniref:Uncharacterized protein n=1 Tax=Capsulimonas corticalis TaxID=2219043 RepID=A0A402D5Q7_9BACT|nr:hypothetical protein [Capsulimonas corticalis]BDI33428.1 hypothetical protein CCAX7_54790 [Capsulimonas corticalis]